MWESVGGQQWVDALGELAEHLHGFGLTGLRIGSGTLRRDNGIQQKVRPPVIAIMEKPVDCGPPNPFPMIRGGPVVANKPVNEDCIHLGYLIIF